MKNRGEAVMYFMLVLYCVFGASLVERYVFNHALSTPAYGLLMALFFLSAYPILGLNRDTPRGLWGKWTVSKWVWFSLGVGALAILVDIFSLAITRYFSS